MSEIKTIGIAGAGTMGAGIAIVCARAGFRTRVFDLKQDALDRARSADRRASCARAWSAASWRPRSCPRSWASGAARPSWTTSPTATW